MNCTESLPLIASYLDAEISDELAGRLRKHLLDCHNCRMAAQDEKSFKDWFVRPAEVAVPTDFAARVARRAFAGDTGQERDVVLTPSAPPAPRETPILRFALRATAAAAAVIFVLAVAIGTGNNPGGSGMSATTSPSMTNDEIESVLDEMNQAEVDNSDEDSAESR